MQHHNHDFWRRNKWLILRRTTQLTILVVFLLGPWLGIWWAKGNLASNVWFNTLPLTDPLLAIQSFLALGKISSTALLGATLITIFYCLVGGRVFCSWVCPVNVITDIAFKCRQYLNIHGTLTLKRSNRIWLLITILTLASITGTLAWELINPVTIIHRAFIYGFGLAWIMIISIFLFDTFISKRGWCSHLCPVGFFYSLIGKFSIVRISAYARESCSNCGDCFTSCPEPHVINPALSINGETKLILSGDCTNCGRCIDVCPDDVFRFQNRYKEPKGSTDKFSASK